MKIITQKSLEELNRNGNRCNYAISPNGRDRFFLYSTGKNYNEAFDNFVELLEEECETYVGVCEVRESDEHKNEGLITLIGRIIQRTPF